MRGLVVRGKFGFKTVMLSALTGGMAILGVYIPVLFFLAPVLLGYILTAWGSACFFVSVFVSLAGLLPILGWQEALYALALFLPASLVIASMLRGRTSYRGAVAGGAMCFAMALYINLCLPSILQGNDAFSGVNAFLKQEFKPLLEQIEVWLGGNAEPVAEMVEWMSLHTAELTMTFIVIVSMPLAFFNVLIAYALFGRRMPDTKKMTPFIKWQLSRQFIYGIIILFAGGLVAEWTELYNHDALMVTVRWILVIPFALMGICLMEFTIQAVPINTGFRRTLAYTMGVVLLPYSIFIFAVIGIIDRVFKIRKRILIIKKD